MRDCFGKHANVQPDRARLLVRGKPWGFLRCTDVLKVLSSPVQVRAGIQRSESGAEAKKSPKAFSSP